jgi:hypothetical protein
MSDYPKFWEFEITDWRGPANDPELNVDAAMSLIRQEVEKSITREGYCVRPEQVEAELERLRRELELRAMSAADEVH